MALLGKRRNGGPSRITRAVSYRRHCQSRHANGNTFLLCYPIHLSFPPHARSLALAGFLLDGGVHQTALLRTVLPNLPTTIVSSASLHRTHIPPHDTVIGLASHSPSATTSPHGPPTRLKGIIKESDIPSDIGKSSPNGTILLSFGTPDLPNESKIQGGLVVTTVNGQVVVGQKGGKWVVTTTGAKDSDVKDETKEGPGEGVKVEVGMFARAVAAVKEGKKNDEKDLGTPRGAMWDLAVIEALLTSNGKTVELESLISGK